MNGFYIKPCCISTEIFPGRAERMFSGSGKKKLEGVLTGLSVQVAVYQASQPFSIVLPHVHELDAPAIGRDVAYYRGPLDAAQAGADLDADRIAHGELRPGFEEGAAEADRAHARRAGPRPFDLRCERRRQRDAQVTSGVWERQAGLFQRLMGGADAC